MSLDISVVIPHRGPDLGLWSTIHSCHQDLERTNLTAKYIVVTNGEKKLSHELAQCLDALSHAGLIEKHIHSEEPLTPPAARQQGAAAASGRYLAFFDNHCIVTKDYFVRAVMDMEQYGMDMLHSTTLFYAKGIVNYEYKLRLNYNFWAESCLLPRIAHKPYEIAVAGHGGFLVRKSVWDEVGGYGPDGLFVGYGGEELLFDLKMRRYGKNNWIDPKLIHYHYTGERGYARQYTDDYYTNMLVTANVIGGEKWMYKLFDSFVTKSHIRFNPKQEMFKLLETAWNRSAEYAREVDAKSKMSLDELLVYFRQNEIRA